MIALPRFGLAALLIALMTPVIASAARPPEMNARVIWIRDARVYVASIDSTALEPGDRLKLFSRGKEIATAEVSRVIDATLAIADLVSGALPSGIHLDRIRLRAERPPLRAMPLLRIGVPASGRACLLFGCDRLTVRPPQGEYVPESWSDRTTRLVRDSSQVARAPWPDTLVVRQFDDPGDEEIALERGELDAAVFWPGELSAHMRQQPRWQGFLFGTRSRGVVAAWWIGAGAADQRAHAEIDPSSFASFNQHLFRGDLGPCGSTGATALATRPTTAVSLDRATRFGVDPVCPGRQAIERFLNHTEPADGSGDRPPRIWLTLLEFPGAAPDSVRSRVACLFTLRCPILCEAKLRPYLSALGSGALADLMECAPAPRQP